MRRFKISNRTKRKYIRRQHHVSTSHAAKNWNLNFLPLTILTIALITFGIVAKNMFGNVPIAINYQPPTFSISDIINVFQSLFENMRSTVLYIWNEAFISFIAIKLFFVSVGETIYYMIQLIDLKPFIGLIKQTLLNLYTYLNYLIDQIIYLELKMQAIYFILNNILYTNILLLFLFVAQQIYAILNISYNFTLSIILTICSFLSTTSHYLAINITILFKNTIYFLGTPFRYLAAFWLVIKPYVDYFLAHVQMTLRDFNYGVHSLSSVTSLKPVK